jgi:opacity protein-like surface antigen
MSRTHFLRHFAAVAAMATGVIVASACTTRAATFDDYRVPDHHVLQWTGSLGGRTSWGSSFQPSSSSWSGNGSGEAATQASGLAESEASLTTWSASASTYGYRTHDLVRGEPAWTRYWQEQESWAHSLSESFSLSATRRWWPAGSPLHAVAAASAAGDFDQGWNWTRLDQRVPPFAVDPSAILRFEEKNTRRAWSRRAWGSAGVGVGRTRDATGAYEARLLEARLREAGLLARPLSATALRDLAALLTVRRDVSSTHDNSAAIVWADIQRILAADGALRDEALSARDWFRLTEPWFARSGRSSDASMVPTSPVLRLRGWTLEARLEGRTGEYTTHRSAASSQFYVGSPAYSTSSMDQRDVSSGDRALAGLAGEAHLPLGMRLQVDASASVLADLRPGQHGIDQRADASARWMAAPRWLASLDFSQVRTCFSGRGTSLADDAWAVLYGAGAQYAVTDHVSAALGFAQTHSRQGQGANPATSSWQINNRGQVSFGLSYRFAGRTSAPGLFPGR